MKKRLPFAMLVALAFFSSARADVVTVDNTAPIVLTGNTTYTVEDGTGPFTFSGVISDAGNAYGITKDGPGALIFTGANTYTGTTTISGGSLQLPVASQANAIDGYKFAGNGTLVLAMRASDTLVKSNFDDFSGTVQLVNSNYEANTKLNTSGTTLVFNPGITLDITNQSQLFVTTDPDNKPVTCRINLTGEGNRESRGAIRMGGGTVSGPITLTGNASIGLEGGSVASTITGSATSGNIQTLTLGTPNSKSAIPFSGVISDGSNGGKLAITAAYGTPTLSGVNTYTGATTVNSGASLIYNVGADQTVTLSGGVAGAGTFTKTGSGTLDLPTANSFTGAYLFKEGTVNVNQTNNGLSKTCNITVGSDSTTAYVKLVQKALGDHEGSVTLYNGSTIEMAGSDISIANSKGITFVGGGTITGSGYFWLRGNGNQAFTVTGAGAVATIGATLNVYSGNSTINVQEADSSLNINSNINQWDAANLSSNLLKTGAGTLTLNGASAIAGAFTVSEGTVNINKTNNGLPTTCNITVGSDSTTAYLKLAQKALGDHTGSVTLYNGSTIEMAGNDISIANNKGITFVGGGTITGNGYFWLRGNGNQAFTVTGAGAIATIGATLNVYSGNSTINVEAADSSLTINSNINQWDAANLSSNLLKTGAGTLTLNGANAIAGAFTVSEGTVNINKAYVSETEVGLPKTCNITVGSDSTTAYLKLAQKALGDHEGSVTLYNGSTIEMAGNDISIGNSKGITFVGGGTITGNGYFWLRGNGNQAFTVTGAGASALINAGSLYMYGGSSFVDVQEADSSLTINSNIIQWDPANLSAGLIKKGKGELILGGENTFKGALTVNEGTVSITNAKALQNVSNVAVNYGAIIDLNDLDIMVPMAIDGGWIAVPTTMTDDVLTSGYSHDTAGVSFANGGGFILDSQGQTYDWQAVLSQPLILMTSDIEFEGYENAVVDSSSFLMSDFGERMYFTVTQLYNPLGGYMLQTEASVPEPATWLTLILCALGLPLLCRRRK